MEKDRIDSIIRAMIALISPGLVAGAVTASSRSVGIGPGYALPPAVFSEAEDVGADPVSSRRVGIGPGYALPPEAFPEGGCVGDGVSVGAVVLNWIAIGVCDCD